VVFFGFGVGEGGVGEPLFFCDFWTCRIVLTVGVIILNSNLSRIKEGILVIFTNEHQKNTFRNLQRIFVVVYRTLNELVLDHETR